MWSFFKRKPVLPAITPEAKIFNAFEEFTGDKKAIIKTLIAMYVPGEHIHKSVGKGVKRIPKIKVTD